VHKIVGVEAQLLAPIEPPASSVWVSRYELNLAGHDDSSSPRSSGMSSFRAAMERVCASARARVVIAISTLPTDS
jgi:hypothetical protein